MKCKLIGGIVPTGGSASESWRQTFTFDRYGNRNFDEANTTTLPGNCGTSPNFTVCAADKKIYDPAINTGNNRLSTSDGYSYDDSGNTTGDAEGRTFVYDAENKQVEVRDQGSVVRGQYWYDGDGKRVKKIAYDANGNETETTIFVYDAGGKSITEYSDVVANSTDAKVAYLTADHLGSPRINTDQDGAVTARHDYMPFGEEIDGTGGRTTGLDYPGSSGDGIRKQFTGYEADGETNLDFAEARYYNKKHGRFTSVDPLMASATSGSPQSWNRYIYVGNNPLNITDPTGMVPGDYYSYDGTYLTHDDKDDDKVYFATVSKIENGSIYAYADSIKETTIDEVIRVQGNGREDINPVQVLTGTIADGFSAGVEGLTLGGVNTLIDALNTSTQPGRLPFAFAGIPNTLRIPNIAASNSLAQSYNDTAKLGIAAGTVVAGGVFGGGSSPSVVPASSRPAFPTIGPGPFAAESIPARGSGPLNAAEQAEINAIGGRSGCHTCGTLNPGTKSGNFVGDHQLPSNIVPPGTPQRIYPHCLGCSRRQGGEVRTLLHGQY